MHLKGWTKNKQLLRLPIWAASEIKLRPSGCIWLLELSTHVHKAAAPKTHHRLGERLLQSGTWGIRRRQSSAKTLEPSRFVHYVHSAHISQLLVVNRPLVFLIYASYVVCRFFLPLCKPKKQLCCSKSGLGNFQCYVRRQTFDPSHAHQNHIAIEWAPRVLKERVLGWLLEAILSR